MDTPVFAHEKEVLPRARFFTVESQSVALEIDFQQQCVKGRTEIRVQPHGKDSRTFHLNCRHCTITKVTVGGKAAEYTYDDPYSDLSLNPKLSVRQYHFLKRKVDAHLAGTAEGELIVTLNKRVDIKESEQYKALKREGPELSETADIAGRYASLTIAIEFETTGLRDGLQWVGCLPGDARWPHAYTRNSAFTGAASCVFPCVDDIHSRHPWDVSITTPRTLGDAFRKKKSSEPSAGTERLPETANVSNRNVDTLSYYSLHPGSDELGLSEQEKELEFTIAMSGELTGENVDPNDPTRKTYSFSIPSSVSANQVGFAIGPFEDIDLSEFREVDDDEKLGEAAIRVHGFCLPGRAAEIRNTCMPLAKAIDFFTTTFTTYTGESFKMCFVDDLVEGTTETAGLAICSTRLLFPEDVIDPLPTVTRSLVFALASQWSGINLVPKETADTWAIAGIAAFMTDIFMRSLSGRNEYRYQQKLAADKVYEQDLNRPSLHDIGRHLELDPEERKFMTLKAGVVFFILDQRFLKASGTSGMVRVVGRILNSAKSEESESSFLSTEKFIYQCSKSGHQKLDTFFNQWVYSAGCPSFQVLQEMNKKKLQILMTFTQTHVERAKTARDLDPSNFLRETREELKGVWAGEVPLAFVGPMTISIHEADGTPYDHTVEIPSAHWVTQIPYNTKYKRMRRGRRQKDRARAVGMDGPDTQDDVLLYSLGDNLQLEEDVAEWKLSDWDADMEQKMSEESYEWIRMDADFEWICQMTMKMPAYMWMSQLQQDKDVVAQMESLQWVNHETKKTPHPLISTFLLRTLLDKRYFHGIRTMAAERLANCAKQELDWIGLFHMQKAFQELYCVSPDSPMPSPNDFSDRHSYIVQCAILQGLADVRDGKGRAPAQVKKFFMDKLKFNDNSSNEFSDSFYVSQLLSCLTTTLLGSPRSDDDEEEDADSFVLQRDAIAEIERYKRINEWTPSFHNVFTTTALDCLVRLAKGGVVKPNYKELLQYTRPDHSDQVRIKAFDCLVDLDMHKHDSVMAYLLYELSNDSSPYMREKLFRVFGRGLGKIAIGNLIAEKPAPAPEGGLVIEQESDQITATIQTMLDRRQTVNGAVKALKAEIGDNESFQVAMWTAIKSPILSLREVSQLLDLCAIIFEPQDALPITLKMPRFWQCKHVGDGKLRFQKTGSYRSKELVPLDWHKSGRLEKKDKPQLPSSTPVQAARPATISRKPSHASSVPRPSTLSNTTVGAVHLTNGADTPQADPSKRTILKLQVKTKNTMKPPTPSQSVQSPATISRTPSFANGAAPYGFGTIASSPTARSRSRSPSLIAGAMSPPARRVSVASVSSNPSNKRRRSSTTKPGPVFAPDGHDLQGSAISSRSASPVHQPTANGNGYGFAPIHQTNGSKKRKSETPQPSISEPPKKTLKLKLGNFKKESPAPTTAELGSAK